MLITQNYVIFVLLCDRISFYSECFYSAYNSKLCLQKFVSLCEGCDSDGEVGEGTESGEESFWLGHLLLHLTWKKIIFFSIISVRSSQCLCCRGVKQPWHETTDFPLLGKDQKPNVSQTLLLLTLKRYKLGELLHGPSENFLESWAFFVRFGESWCKETFEDGSGTLWGKFRWRDREPGFPPHRHFPHTLFCANKNFFGNL